MRVRLLLIASLLLSLWSVELRAEPAASVQQMLENFGVQLPRESRPAPLFTLPKLDGGEVSLADFHGKLVLLHFWASWCVPCRHEMPLLHQMEQKMEQKMDAAGFRMLCINVNRGGRREVQAFIDQVSPQFHTLLDPEGRVRNRYAVRGLPTTYLIGGDGRIIGRIIGERDWSSPAVISMLMALVGQAD